MSEEAPRNGTTAAIDRRVERLELAQGQLAAAVERVELEQRHSREVSDLRFSGLESAVKAQGVLVTGVDAKLDTMIQTFQAAVVESSKMVGDLKSTPAGREVAEDIHELKLGREENRLAIVGLQLSVAKGAGAITVILALLTLFGPAIRHLFGLPA